MQTLKRMLGIGSEERERTVPSTDDEVESPSVEEEEGGEGEVMTATLRLGAMVVMANMVVIRYR